MNNSEKIIVRNARKAIKERGFDMYLIIKNNIIIGFTQSNNIYLSEGEELKMLQ